MVTFINFKELLWNYEDRIKTSLDINGVQIFHNDNNYNTYVLLIQGFR